MAACKLTAQTARTIRAWAQGPGQGLRRIEQAQQLAKGIPKWFENQEQVTVPTLLSLLIGDTWGRAGVDNERLLRWEATNRSSKEVP